MWKSLAWRLKFKKVRREYTRGKLKNEEHLLNWAMSAEGRVTLPEIIELLSNKEEDLHLRFSAAMALGAIKDRRAVPALIEALENKTLAEPAAIALGCIGDDRAVETLVKLLKDERSINATAATTALGLIGDSRAIEDLRMALHHSDWGVRKAAEEALTRIESKA